MRRLIRLAWVPTFAAAIQLSAQTSGPVNPDYVKVVEAGRSFIKAARDLDREAMLRSFVTYEDADQQRGIRDLVWVIHAVQPLRHAAEKKFGPVPEYRPDMVEEEWEWGVVSEAYYDDALKTDPSIVQINQNAATIAVLPGVEFAKQGDGRWLITLDDGSAIAEPDDAKVKAAIEKHIATVLADIEAGRVRSPGEIPSLFFSLFGG